MQPPSGSQTTMQTDTQASPCSFNRIYPRELADAERELIRTRRKDLDLPDTTLPIGVALSGGGIRSATFCLGLFQALARHDVLKRIDYLSTVSGGGYFGGFFGKLFLSAGQASTPADAAQKVRDTLADTQSSPVDWLRENGRYIAPKGGGDYFFAASTYLRNWTAVQYVTGVTLLTMFLLANVLRGCAWGTSWGTKLEALVGNAMLPQIWLSPWVIVPAFVAAFALIPLGAAYWLTQKYQRLGVRKSFHGPIEWNYPALGLLVVILMCVAAQAAPYSKTLSWVPQSDITTYFYGYVTVAGLLTFGLYIAAKMRAPSDHTVIPTARNRLSSGLSLTLLFFLMLGLFGLVDSLGQTFYAISTSTPQPILFTGFLTTALVLLARQFASFLSKDPTKATKLIRIPANLVSLIVGLLLGLVVATFWAGVAHAILWKGETPSGNPGQKLLAFYASPSPQVSLSPDNYIVVSRPNAPTQQPPLAQPALELATAAFLLVAVISLLSGKTMSFLNLSSIQEFYASRLSRAYLGASNPRRTGFGGRSAVEEMQTRETVNVTKVVPQDDVTFSDYHPEKHGGPLHLINVTINETVAGASQLEQRDRKGMGMTVGPCGISAARLHHALWSKNENEKQCEIRPILPDSNQFAVFNTKPTYVESLSLGQWVAVSGAAFSTGLGARTNLGLSLLMGFSNVRIGYWWDSGISPRERFQDKPATKQAFKISDLLEPLFSTQVYLSDEFLARFHGPHRQRWYLSDGGHFENTAAHELIRRRLPFIIVSDNGCDQDYLFDDLANMIRKARIDFNAEIRFLNEDELDEMLDQNLRKIIGTPAELQRRITEERSPCGNTRLEGKAYSNCNALLARIYYDGSPQAGSLMLIVKPSLTGDEPLDLLEYHAKHPEFPQESTLDQFFDEAQWESYRKLGSNIGDSLFAAMPSLDEWVQRFIKPLSKA